MNDYKSSGLIQYGKVSFNYDLDDKKVETQW